MKIRSLYKNLDTAFVNLPALLRYLRQRGFAGLVRVDIGDYKAEIIFDEAQRIRLLELGDDAGEIVSDDGRIVPDDVALQRLLVRARAPGGLVDVYQAVGAVESGVIAPDENEDILELTPPETAPQEPPQEPRVATQAPAKTPKPTKPAKVFASALENGNGIGNGKPPNGSRRGAQLKPYTNGSDDSEAGQDFLPVYSDQIEVVEERPEPKRKVSYLSADDWEELTALTAALLATADNILKTANLGFTDAFNKARIEISGECPFLHPEHGVFHYAEGRVGLYEEVPPNLLVSGVSECLRRILNKLVSNPKFFALYKRITQQILILVRQRQPQFDKFGYTRQLERIIKF